MATRPQANCAGRPTLTATLQLLLPPRQEKGEGINRGWERKIDTNTQHSGDTNDNDFGLTAEGDRLVHSQLSSFHSILHRQVQLKFCWQFILGIKSIRKIDTSYAAVGMNVQSTTSHQLTAANFDENNQHSISVMFRLSKGEPSPICQND